MTKKIISITILYILIYTDSFSMNSVGAAKIFDDENDENRVLNGQNLETSCFDNSLIKENLTTKLTRKTNSTNYRSSSGSTPIETKATGSFLYDLTLQLKNQKDTLQTKNDQRLLKINPGFYHNSGCVELISPIRSKMPTGNILGNFASFELSLMAADEDNECYEECYESYTTKQKFVSGVVEAENLVYSCKHYKRPYEVRGDEEERACSELALLGFLDKNMDCLVTEFNQKTNRVVKTVKLIIHTERDLCFNCARVVPKWVQEKSHRYNCHVHVIALSQLDYCTPRSPCCSGCIYVARANEGNKTKKEQLKKVIKALEDRGLAAEPEKKQTNSATAIDQDTRMLLAPQKLHRPGSHLRLLSLKHPANNDVVKRLFD